jgi:NADPH2:quinone reductase
LAGVRGIELTRFGGPETLVVTEVAEPVANDSRQVLDIVAAGVNYADTHQTQDTYLAPQKLPLIPGVEVVVRAPDGGRLVGVVPHGGYAQRIAVDPGTMFAVPETVSDGAALTTVIQGATAWHLFRTSTHLRPGESVVVHAGAGGVGTIAIQLARLWGAGRIIATASNPQKRRLAEDLGADVAIDSTEPELGAAIRAANDGHGVDIVLEMTGGQVFDESLAALAPLGRLAVFGMASRTAPTPITASALLARSTAVIGFWLAHVLWRPQLYTEAVTDLLALIEAGTLRTVIGGTFALDHAADAHRALIDRGSVGKLVLDPWQ